MKYRFLRVPVSHPEDGEQALNRFLAGHRISRVEKQWVADGEHSFWAFCIGYEEGAEPVAEKRAKVDYREVLNQADFAVYAKLRSLRKEIAEKENVPAYALFTNEHLAAMVQNRVRSAEAMAAIPGVGKARLEKYAAPFLEILSGRGKEGVDGPSHPG